MTNNDPFSDNDYSRTFQTSGEGRGSALERNKEDDYQSRVLDIAHFEADNLLAERLSAHNRILETRSRRQSTIWLCAFTMLLFFNVAFLLWFFTGYFPSAASRQDIVDFQIEVTDLTERMTGELASLTQATEMTLAKEKCPERMRPVGLVGIIMGKEISAELITIGGADYNHEWSWIHPILCMR